MQPSVRQITHMLRNDYEGQLCSIARSLELIGERWTLLVIREVFFGRRRFSEMQKTLGVARNVLTNRLQRLVDEGILERRPYSERPSATSTSSPRRASTSGRPMVSLMHWGDKHMPLPGGPPMIARPQGRVRRRRSTTAASASSCGKELTVREARRDRGPRAEARARELERAGRRAHGR